MGEWATIGLSVGVVLAVVAAYLGWVVWSNRRAGAHGLVRRVRLTCPECHRAFDYALVPGASLSAVRLGRSRFLACPLCHRWSVVRVSGAPPASSRSGPSDLGPPP